MSNEKTEGIVIRQVDFSETSRVVTWFTRDWGKIATMAKGAKRLKGPFEAAIDLLSHCRIVFIRKVSSTLDLLTQADLVSKFQLEDRDLTGLYGGYYIAELLDRMFEDYDPHPELFDFTIECLERIGSRPDPKNELIRYELFLLREIGHLPRWDVCIACEKPLKENGPYEFWLSQGGLLCQECQKSEYRRNPVDDDTLKILNRFSQIDRSSSTAVELEIEEKHRKQMRPILTAVVSDLLGQRPKLIRYIS